VGKKRRASRFDLDARSEFGNRGLSKCAKPSWRVLPYGAWKDLSIVDGVTVGEVLAGKYRVDKIIGSGGMGVVVLAHHLQLDERVAIKFLLPDALANKEAVTRFTREARAVVKIKNEHIVRVSDVGTLDNGSPYMVMEYLEGVDLSTLLQQRGRLPIADTADLVLQACEALADAHALRIVHRDLKPSNLFIVRRSDGSPCVKLIDFGISKMTTAGTGGQDLGMTKTSTAMGSPLYMSPEQMVSSRDVDARTDIWALGIVLYELLAGTPPFSGETMPEVCIKIATFAHPPLRSARQDVPEALEAIVDRCLEKKREDRYPSIADLAAELAPFGSNDARASANRVARIARSTGDSWAPSERKDPSGGNAAAWSGPDLQVNATAGSWGRTIPSARGAKRVVLAAIAVLALVAVATVTLLVKRSEVSSAPSSALVQTPTAAAGEGSTIPPTAPAFSAASPHEVPAVPAALPSRNEGTPPAAPIASSPSGTLRAGEPVQGPRVRLKPAPVPKAPPPRAAPTPTATQPNEKDIF
jgi:serine/threonine protein kinase